MEEAATVDDAAERKKAAAATGLMWKAPAAMVNPVVLALYLCLLYVVVS